MSEDDGLSPAAEAPLEDAERLPRCRCGHGKSAHSHYRRGTDCSLCDCPRFRRARRPSTQPAPAFGSDGAIGSVGPDGVDDVNGVDDSDGISPVERGHSPTADAQPQSSGS
jgi:hypothetical protein